MRGKRGQARIENGGRKRDENGDRHHFSAFSAAAETTRSPVAARPRHSKTVPVPIYRLLWGGFALVSTHGLEQSRDKAVHKLYRSIVEHKSRENRRPESDTTNDNMA